MTEAQARQIKSGDRVIYKGQPHRVTSVKLNGGVGAPYFRLEGVRDGLTSYRLCAVYEAPVE
jgi:translation elongation factor P/translation initiation factor 5A